MTTWIVTRHPGALAWLKRFAWEQPRVEVHLDVKHVVPGDHVVGTLPIQLVAELQARGAHYFHLTFDTPAGMRGQELSAEQLDAFGVRLQAYAAVALELPPPTSAV